MWEYAAKPIGVNEMNFLNRLYLVEVVVVVVYLLWQNGARCKQPAQAKSVVLMNASSWSHRALVGWARGADTV